MFNAATFLDATHMSDRQVQRLGHEDDVDSKSRLHRLAVQQAPRASHEALMIQWLEQAAARFAIRRDGFAAGKQDTCLDIASKLQRFGSFASERQEEFARKLIEWSLPRGAAMPWQQAQAPAQAPVAAPVAPTPAPAPAVVLPRLFDLMQRLSKLTIGEITIARKNGDSLCWVKLAGHEQVVGKIEHGTLTLWPSRLRGSRLAADVELMLLDIERDPEAAAVLHGKASGRCAICNRDLTDPTSIARGIGPICIEKAGF